jgi:hypothetical protein
MALTSSYVHLILLAYLVCRDWHGEMRLYRSLVSSCPTALVLQAVGGRQQPLALHRAAACTKCQLAVNHHALVAGGRNRFRFGCAFSSARNSGGPTNERPRGSSQQRHQPLPLLLRFAIQQLGSLHSISALALEYERFLVLSWSSSSSISLLFLTSGRPSLAGPTTGPSVKTTNCKGSHHPEANKQTCD